VSRKWLRGSTGSSEEAWGSNEGVIGEQRGSTLTKWALAGEQSGGTLVSGGLRIGLSSGNLYIYILRCGVQLINEEKTTNNISSNIPSH